MTNQDLYATGLSLWNRWVDMWNGRPALALELVAPRFTLHLILPSTIAAETVTDPPSTEAWVRAHIAKFDHLKFHLGVGPFVDERAGVVAGPWHADTVIAGVASVVCGMDTIAFSDGKITEYWTMSKPAAAALGTWGQTQTVQVSSSSQ